MNTKIILLFCCLFALSFVSGTANSDPNLESVANSDGCITVCCYVMYYLEDTDTGTKCNSGGLSHCPDCCMVNCPVEEPSEN